MYINCLGGFSFQVILNQNNIQGILYIYNHFEKSKHHRRTQIFGAKF